MKRVLKAVALITTLAVLVAAFCACNMVKVKDSPTRPGSEGDGSQGTSVPDGGDSSSQITLSFDVAGGSAVPAIKLAAGAALSAPADPVREGYTFAGWFRGDSATAYKFTTMPEVNLTLTAHWTANSYTISFAVAGGSAVPDAEVEYGKRFSLGVSSRTGYVFAGWKTEAGLVLASASGEGLSRWNVASDVELQAIWNPVRYSVTYENLRGAEHSNPSGFNTGSPEITLADPVERAGYVFTGWFDAPSDGNKVTEIPQGSIGDRTLYAGWIVSEYSITYENLHGASPENPSGYTIETETITLRNPGDRPGYEFSCWQLADGASVTEIPQGSAGDLEIHAIWIPIVYTVTYENVGSAENPNPESYTCESETILLTDLSVPDGYAFSGWFDSPSGGNKVTEISNGSMGDKTLYARREFAEYSITYENLQGVSHSNPAAYNIEISGIDFAAPADRPGYVFEGWYDSLSGGHTVTEIKPERYRGVYFTQYRPYYCSSGSSADKTYQDDNGYNTFTVYWFRYEPVKWRILNEEDGTALILCETAIDAMQYDYDGTDYNNDYAESTIRAWLNDTFYDTAFSDAQKALIRTTSVDNGASGTGSDPNRHACADTDDKIFLLSYEEAANAAYGFTTNAVRKKGSTDYAQSQGCRQSTSSGTWGNCCWWLRSPDSVRADNARTVNDLGGVGDSFGVRSTFLGVVPALTISLSDSTVYARTDAYGNPDESGDYILFGDYPQTKVTDSELISALGNYASNVWMSCGYYSNGAVSDLIEYTDKGSNGIGDKTLYARWSIVEYPITYKDLYGVTHSNPTKYTIESEKITLQNPGDRPHYDFAGWQLTDGTAITEIPKGSTGDLEIHAIWTPIDYTLTYENLQGAEQSNPDNYNIESADIVLAAPADRTGYTFVGWYDAESGGNMITEIPQGSTGDKTLYARWTPIEYSITYNNLQDASNPNPSVYTIESEKITLQNPGDRVGYTFTDWFDAETEGNKITEIAQGNTGNKTLYARWNLIDYAITYENLQGSTHTNIANYNIESTDIVLSSPTERAHYTFTGWYNSATGGTKITKIAQGSYGNKTLYARWIPIEYTVTYALDGGTNNPNNPSVYTIETETITLQAPSRASYDFAGWFDAPTDGNIVTEIPQGSTGDITLYARWTPHDYTLTYENVGGVSNPNPGSYTCETETIVLADLSADAGYTFGWYDAESGGNMVTKIPKGSTGDVTLYARWSPIEYTITYADLHDETHSNPEKYTIESEKITLSAPSVRTGYDFTGWFDSASGGNKVTEIPKGNTGNKTLYARWTPIEYTITYENLYDTTHTNSTTYNIESADINLTAPTDRIGYTFIGWYDSLSGGNKVTKIAQGSYGNKTLYARWTPIQYTVTYVLNGGINDPDNPSKYTIENLESAEGTIPLKDPQKRKKETGNYLGNGLYELTTTTYIFNGWYKDNSFTTPVTKLSLSLGSVTLYAKWSASTSTDSNKNYLRINADSTANSSGRYILFGEYPQTKVTDSATLSALGDYASNTWTSYGYYISGSVNSFMQYTDKEYNGSKYRGVYFTSYRPRYCSDPSSADDSWQDENGYNTSTVYWFKYEPIKWRILNESGGNALILCETAIDSQQWDYETGDEYGHNNYKESTIRKWLNETFYDTAFSSLQQALIQTTTVNNSVFSTGYDENQYACADTNDKIFLLSYKEATNAAYGFASDDETADQARQKKSTDYAKAQGCYVSKNSSDLGNCYWWLRSPSCHDGSGARFVSRDGDAHYLDSVSYASGGVVPVLTIKL